MEISYKRITKGRNNGNHSETANDFRGWCDWVIERTLAWIGRNRRMSKDYEYLPSSSESMVQLTMIRLMLKRLARATDSARETAQRLHAA